MTLTLELGGQMVNSAAPFDGQKGGGKPGNSAEERNREPKGESACDPSLAVV